jgi:pilus assembly protein Flp/PilA
LFNRIEGAAMFRHINSIVRDNRGIAALEYALIAGLMFAAIIGATSLLTPKLSTAFSHLGASITARDAAT